MRETRARPVTENRKVFLCPLTFEHMGAKSGLAPLERHLIARFGSACERVAAPLPAPHRAGLRRRLWNAVARRVPLPRKSPDQTQVLVWSEVQAKENPFYTHREELRERETLRRIAKGDFARAAIFLSGIEDQLHLLAEAALPSNARIVGWSHQPPSWWRLHHARPEIVSKLDALIVLSSEAASFWSRYLPTERIHFIRHGVDSTFFAPRERVRPAGAFRIVFGGQWLRDFDTLAAVAASALARWEDVAFDLIVPTAARAHPALLRLARQERVRWLRNLSDEQLREVYQGADMALLPLIDATANNSLLEAMACGLPTVASRVGGIPDYASDEAAILVSDGGASAYLDAIDVLKSDPAKRDAMGRAARRLAETELDWRLQGERFAQVIDDQIA